MDDKVELPPLRPEEMMSREELASFYVWKSGKQTHTSDCATSRAPAYMPGPCDCDATDVPHSPSLWHADHGWHWDRTCPACIQEAAPASAKWCAHCGEGVTDFCRVKSADCPMEVGLGDRT